MIQTLKTHLISGDKRTARTNLKRKLLLQSFCVKNRYDIGCVQNSTNQKGQRDCQNRTKMNCHSVSVRGTIQDAAYKFLLIRRYKGTVKIEN